MLLKSSSGHAQALRLSLHNEDLLKFENTNKENKVLIYTARTIVERGKVPTVSKTHFPPSDKKVSKKKKCGRGSASGSVSSDDTGSERSFIY